jgi:hypothetical protein
MDHAADRSASLNRRGRHRTMAHAVNNDV